RARAGRPALRGQPVHLAGAGAVRPRPARCLIFRLAWSQELLDRRQCAAPRSLPSCRKSTTLLIVTATRVAKMGLEMTCKPSACPAPEDVNIPALRERYRQERTLRLRPEGQHQYVAPADHFVHDTYDRDPHMAVAPRDSVSEDLDV